MSGSRSTVLIILCLVPLALFSNLNTLELRAEEPRRAVVALEMGPSGEYAVPRIHGAPYYNKPPLFNWVMAACFHLFGYGREWIARLPSLLALLATALAMFFLARIHLGREVAFLSALLFLTAADILFYGAITAAEIDLFYALIVFLQIMSLFSGYRSGRRLGMFVLSYFFMALGVLVKGLPSIAFQGLTLAGMAVYERRIGRLFDWRHFLGGAAALVILGAYGFWYQQTEPLWPFAANLLKESAQRSGLESGGWDTLLAALLFPLRVFQLLLPGSLLLLLAFKRGIWRNITREPLLMFALVFIVSNIWIYWFTAELRNRYIYMFFPFFAFFPAYLYVHRAGKAPHVMRRLERIWGLVIILLFAGPPILLVPDISAAVPALPVKVLGISLAGGACLWWFVRRPRERLQIFLIAVLVIRIGFNLVYLPILQEQSRSAVYREDVRELLVITGGAPVHLTGRPAAVEKQIRFGPLDAGTVVLQTPPLMAFQIPYYVTRETGAIMRYEPEPRPGRFYMLPEDDPQADSVTVLYRLRDRWLQRDMLLFYSP